jgi:AcrR family transcriptional regulator
MEALNLNIQLQVNKNLYIKHPESSKLGKNIIQSGIDLIYSIGYESFNFRKLAKMINTSEASIYRYFESKVKFLLYLTNWYWSWNEYRLAFQLANVDQAEERLKRAIHLITEEVTNDGSFEHINEAKLHQIVALDSPKIFLIKQVDNINQEGAFLKYKDFVDRLSEIILELNPNYPYSHMLISTVIEGAHMQRHFADHLPRLTDQIEGKDAVTDFYQSIVFKAIQKK